MSFRSANQTLTFSCTNENNQRRMQSTILQPIIASVSVHVVTFPSSASFAVLGAQLSMPGNQQAAITNGWSMASFTQVPGYPHGAAPDAATEGDGPSQSGEHSRIHSSGLMALTPPATPAKRSGSQANGSRTSPLPAVGSAPLSADGYLGAHEHALSFGAGT
jgi:hypothetical protein